MAVPWLVTTPEAVIGWPRIGIRSGVERSPDQIGKSEDRGRKQLALFQRLELQDDRAAPPARRRPADLRSLDDMLDLLLENGDCGAREIEDQPLF